jgi:hypothetical protein
MPPRWGLHQAPPGPARAAARAGAAGRRGDVHAHPDDAARQDGRRPARRRHAPSSRVTVFNELWEAERAKIREDELLLVEGKVQKDDFSGGLRISADKLYTLAEARGRYARGLAPDHERRFRRQTPAGAAGALPQRPLPGAAELPQRRCRGGTAAARQLARAARRCPAGRTEGNAHAGIPPC